MLIKKPVSTYKCDYPKNTLEGRYYGDCESCNSCNQCNGTSNGCGNACSWSNKPA